MAIACFWRFEFLTQTDHFERPLHGLYALQDGRFSKSSHFLNRIPESGNLRNERKIRRLKPQRDISMCFLKARNAVHTSHVNSRGCSGENLELPGYRQHFKLNRYFNPNFYVVLLINGCTGNNYCTINSKSRIGSTISLTQLRLSRICLELEI